MVTIHNLEVRFDVEGDSDEAVFARLFEQYLRRHQQGEQAARERERRLQSESRLGDQAADTLP